MLENILLDDPARAKLGIYQLILEIDAGEYPIHYFEKKTGYSHIKTANLLQGMKEDLLVLDPECVLMTPKEKVSVQRKMPSMQNYQQYLFGKSIPYRALLQTLLEPKKNLKYFGKKTKMSQSSLMRRLKPLVDYLRSKDIRLNCLQMEVTGREAAIRIMYFNFLWMVNFGTELYDFFQETEGVDLDDYLTPEELEYLKYVEKREFSLYRGIALLRTAEGRFIDESEINRLVYPNNVSKKFKETLGEKGIPETYQEREANFVSYMVFYWAQLFANNDPRLPIIRRNYRNMEDIRQKAQKFVANVVPHIHELSKSQQDLLMINCQSVLLRDHLFGDKAPQNLDFIIENLKKQHPRYHELESLVEQGLMGQQSSANLVTLLTLVILPEYERRMKVDNVHIGIVGFPNHFLLYSMIHRIEELPFVDFSLTNTNCEDAFDAVITCSKKLLPEKAKRYWIVEGENSFDAMDDFLFKLFKEKAKES